MKERIGLTEDTRDVVEALHIIFESSGYDCLSITDSQNIAERVSAYEPHLIVLDALLSGTDGQTVARDLRMRKETKKSPILLISAHPAVEKIARETHVDDYIPKPFDINTLLGKIRK